MAKSQPRGHSDVPNWRVRIVGEGEEPAGKLLANPRNWRIHPQHQQAAMAGVLDEIGWVQRVIVNRTTGCVVDGHLRVSLALQRSPGEPVPVVYVELTEAEEAEVLATLDPIAALAATDQAKLDELLAEVESGNAAVSGLLNDLSGGDGKTIDVLEVLPAGKIRYVVTIRGELESEPDVLLRLKDHMLELPGVEVDVAVHEIA